MIKVLIIILVIIFFSEPIFAYKVYSYDSEGNRVYKTVTQEEITKNKNRARRAYIRTPRTNWEITNEMRARKKPFNYKGKN